MMNKIKNPWRHKPGYNCICCSPNNPIGLHLEFWEDGDDVLTHWTPTLMRMFFALLILVGIVGLEITSK